jgi:hypothetical protein
MVTRKPNDIVGLKLRLRESLRRQVEKSAKENKVSLNNEMIRLLESGLKQADGQAERLDILAKLGDALAAVEALPDAAAVVQSASDVLTEALQAIRTTKDEMAATFQTTRDEMEAAFKAAKAELKISAEKHQHKIKDE